MEPIPKDVVMAARYRYRYFNDGYKLKNIKTLFRKPLHKILKEKYKYDDESARLFASFINGFLRVRPTSRSSVYASMNHKWLREDTNDLTFMTQDDWKAYISHKDLQSPSISLNAVESYSELSCADEEDNPETRFDFNFEDAIHRKQELFFNPNNYRFEEVKRHCERSFVNPNVPIGYDEGIDIESMDKAEYYDQFTVLNDK